MTTNECFDVIVIGGGIAGASVAAHLSCAARVCVLEMEAQPGYHSTGRSAAILSDSLGNPTVRALTLASRPFFAAPPPSFTDAALLHPRGLLQTARRQQDLDQCLAATPLEGRRVLTVEEAVAHYPILRPDNLVGAVLSSRPADIDVHALHQGYLRQLRANAGVLRLEGEVLELSRRHDVWTIKTDQQSYRATTIVNAAGAWAGRIGAMAGAADIGLTPLQRTACIIDPPAAYDVAGWPMLKDAGEDYYLKPEAGKLLLSPCDETPSPPGDAQPDDLAVAIAVDRIERATTLQVQRVSHKWAGLRSFVSDRSPVVGFDPIQQGFFWHAALGGYGIQTAPALSRLAAGLLTQGSIPQDLQTLGIRAEVLSPSRLIGDPPEVRSEAFAGD